MSYGRTRIYTGEQWVALQRFKNTVDGLDELSKFIKNRCEKPGIYIKSTGCAALVLLKYLCGIPGIEVVFISQAGFKQYQTCLSKSVAGNSKATFCEAELLADCAERMKK